MASLQPYRRDINVTATSNVTMSVAMCSTTTGAIAMRSYPVFSGEVLFGGTTTYKPDQPLLKLTAATATVAHNTPAFVGSLTAGGFTATMTYGATFALSPVEYDGGSPRRYRYIVYRTSFTPPDQWASSLATHPSVIMTGAINVSVAATSTYSYVTICDVSVR